MRGIEIQGFPEANARLIEKPLRALRADETRINVSYSALNYKDVLAITGKGKIQRQFPLIAGIDVSGTSADDGKAVLCCGAGLGEQFDGGLATQTIVPNAALIALPEKWSEKHAMIIGTAGFTAALAIRRLQYMHLLPENGEVVVTGANGGVGLWSMWLLAKLGYRVVAVVREPKKWQALLGQMGATRLLSLEELQRETRPLGKARFAGGIDNLGGKALAALLAQTQMHGSVASIGLAQTSSLTATVMPFILRGVNLLGITSTNCAASERQATWQFLEKRLSVQEIMTFPHHEIDLAEVIDFCQAWQNRPAGRIIVRVAENLC